MPKLRLSLTIPGAVSLGAYEGGALAALILAARTLGEENVLIDTIASASAGSIHALLTAEHSSTGAARPISSAPPGSKRVTRQDEDVVDPVAALVEGPASDGL